MKHRHIGKYKSRTPKGRVVYKRRPRHNHKLKNKERKIFQRLDKEKSEYGGYMDFDNRGLERADIYFGRADSVDIEITPDKEIDYHTHPMTGKKNIDKLNYFPSKQDIKVSKKFPSQTMLIFHNGKVTVAKKNEDFKVDNKILNNIEKGLRKDVKVMSTKKLFEKYKPQYKKLGLDIRYVDKKGDIKLPIDIYEPKKPLPKATKSLFFDNEPEEDFEVQLQKYKDEREDRLNDPRFADKEEIENLYFEQIADLTERTN